MRHTSSKSVTYRTTPLEAETHGTETVTAPQEKIVNQQALREADIKLYGAGGLGTEIGEALVRKAVGSLTIYDDDIVTPGNLNRQLYFKVDLYKNKAVRLARNLAKMGFGDTVISGIPLAFEDAVARNLDLSASVVVVAIDNNPGRVAASRFYQRLGLPVVFCAVSETADHGYSFVQEPGKACWGCAFPDEVNDETYPCPGTPAVKDILKVVAGITVFAVDTLLPGMSRLRCWNYKSVHLCGSAPGRDWRVQKREDCALCGGGGVSLALPHVE
jgi:molybdopterin/thiamine biosynthesis adenylyltransferase